MNPCVYAFVIMSHVVSQGKLDPCKNKYTPYCSAYNGGGPQGYYNAFPKKEYIPVYNPQIIDSFRFAVYGKIVPVKRQSKN